MAVASVEFDESRTTPAQRDDEGQQRVMTKPENGEINLHLYAGFGLKTCDLLGDRLLHGVQECRQHAVVAIVTALLELAQ